MNKTYSLNTIFQYTESLVKVQEDTLNRLDSKFSTFIGFSSVLVRLAAILIMNLARKKSMMLLNGFRK